MHAIKSRARHAAWSGVYNPWTRRGPALKRPSDPEAGFESSRSPVNTDRGIPDLEARPTTASVHSQGCADEELTLERREEQANTIKTHGTKHATTFPANGSEPSSATSAAYPPISEKINPIEASAISDKTLVDPALRNGKTTGSDNNGGVIHRRNKLKFWKKEPEVEELEKTPTRKSSFNDKHLTIVSQIRAVLFPQWLTINWLLLLVPAGFAVNYAHADGIIIFVINFLAIIPLAGILSYATEEIAMRVGETLGGLLNATFGNAVELIVSILALVKDEVIIVKTSLIGSMLSNLLLVMGMCFFLGGINRVEQFFNETVAQTAASLLALAIGALIIPTAFHSWSNTGTDGRSTESSGSSETPSGTDDGIAPLSRGTAIILLVVYASYLIFQLKSHVHIYNTPSQKVEKRSKKKEEGESLKAIAQGSAGMAAVSGGQINHDKLVAGKAEDEEEEEEESPQLTLIGAIVTLTLSTVLVAFCAEFMVDSIQAVTCRGHVSQTFVGLILLPIVGNAAEHATAVTVAIKDKMDLAIGVAVGSSMQIALLVLPFMVVLGWILGKEDMTMFFDGFQVAVLFVSILLVNYLIGDGKTHWLEGTLLLSLYLIISVAAWFYPVVEDICHKDG